MNKLNRFKKNKIKVNLKSFLVEKVELNIYQKLDSTNNKAKDYIKENNNLINKFESKKFKIFAADIQKAGRGRRGHSWFSDDPASIAVSFLFKAGNNLAQIPQLTAAAGLAVKESLKSFGLQGKLKWPNDILVNNKKICGILSELIFDKKQNAFIVIGTGINLNNTTFNSGIQKLATSYYLEKDKKIDKNLFLSELISNMIYYIENYFSGSRNQIIAEWKKELDLEEKKIDLKYKDKKYTVLIKKVLESGELLVVFDNGQKKRLQSLNTSLDYQSLAEYNNH